MRIGRFAIGRDGYGRCIRWLRQDRSTGNTLNFSYGRIPPAPHQYGYTAAVEQDAVDEDPTILVHAFELIGRNAVETHKELRAKGKRGLRMETLQFFYVAPDEGHPTHLFSWKATAQ